MSHGSDAAACDDAAVAPSTPVTSTAVAPAARNACRARRIHGRTGMDELLYRVETSNDVSVNNLCRRLRGPLNGRLEGYGLTMERSRCFVKMSSRTSL